MFAACRSTSRFCRVCADARPEARVLGSMKPQRTRGMKLCPRGTKRGHLCCACELGCYLSPPVSCHSDWALVAALGAAPSAAAANPAATGPTAPSSPPSAPRPPPLRSSTAAPRNSCAEPPFGASAAAHTCGRRRQRHGAARLEPAALGGAPHLDPPVGMVDVMPDRVQGSVSCASQGASAR